MVKVRFAPSPTGFLHIGGARTALFNYMYARSQQGSFVLRVEDTDRSRSREEYLNEITDSLHWLGLDWDEFYKQSDRFDLYREHAKRLLDSGAAYEDNGAVVLKMPRQEVKFFDLIRGEVVFDTSNFVQRDEAGNNLLDSEGRPVLKDEVLIKADGSPAYSFCCVVDDALTEITHVIRGEDHIPNTPKQILMYQALGFKAPKFAHIPMILNEEGGKMSKRTGAVAVSEYRAKGFLPEALVNYLMLLGWSPGGDQELMTLDSAIKKFSIKKINKSSAAFSMDKLRWINGQYVRQKSDQALADFVAPFLEKGGWIGKDYDRKKLEGIVKLYKTRMADIDEFLERTRYLFEDEFKAGEEVLKSANLSGECFSGLARVLEEAAPFNTAAVEARFREFADQRAMKMSDLVHPVRLILTGSDVGPGLFETMEVLGREKTVKRLKSAAEIS
ncbi:MAG: glutamate--tRNA ligase [Candidatus Omnitrophota bacterium]